MLVVTPLLLISTPTAPSPLINDEYSFAVTRSGLPSPFMSPIANEFAQLPGDVKVTAF